MTELVWKHLSIPFGVILLLMKCNKRQKKKQKAKMPQREWTCSRHCGHEWGTAHVLIVSFQDGGDEARLQIKKDPDRLYKVLQTDTGGWSLTRVSGGESSGSDDTSVFIGFRYDWIKFQHRHLQTPPEPEPAPPTAVKYEIK